MFTVFFTHFKTSPTAFLPTFIIDISMITLFTFSLNLTISPQYKLLIMTIPCIFFFITSFVLNDTKFHSKILSLHQVTNSASNMVPLNSYAALILSVSVIIYYAYSRERDRTNRLHHIIMTTSVEERSSNYKSYQQTKQVLHDMLPEKIVEAYGAFKNLWQHKKKLK